MIVKDNHPILRRKLQCLFASANLFDVEFTRFQQSEISRGRVETRRITVCGAVPEGFTGFAYVRQAFVLERQRRFKKSGLLQTEQVFGITSLSAAQAEPSRLLELVRGHWSIENKSHYVRDVTFAEDKSQVRCGTLPQAMAAIRNVTINRLRLAGHSNIAAALRFYAAQPVEALKLMGIATPITE
jgi:predicted transposase YbfD/YdcC